MGYISFTGLKWEHQMISKKYDLHPYIFSPYPEMVCKNNANLIVLDLACLQTQTTGLCVVVVKKHSVCRPK